MVVYYFEEYIMAAGATATLSSVFSEQWRWSYSHWKCLVAATWAPAYFELEEEERISSNMRWINLEMIRNTKQHVCTRLGQFQMIGGWHFSIKIFSVMSIFLYRQKAKGINTKNNKRKCLLPLKNDFLTKKIHKNMSFVR